MSWFHQTLNDVEEAIKKGDRQRALDIVNEHLRVEGDVNSRITQIKKCLEEYDMHVNMLRTRLAPQVSDAFDRLAPRQTAEGRPKEHFIYNIEHARLALNKLHKLMTEALVEELRLK